MRTHSRAISVLRLHDLPVEEANCIHWGDPLAASQESDDIFLEWHSTGACGADLVQPANVDNSSSFPHTGWVLTPYDEYGEAERCWPAPSHSPLVVQPLEHFVGYFSIPSGYRVR